VTSHRLGAFARVAAVAMSASALVLLAATGVAAKDNPGNNGTVKIHDGAGEPSPEVRNEPHVCTFHLHFFFGDDQQSGTWEIQEWSPGDKGTVRMPAGSTGRYDTQGDGEDRQPPTGAYSLPDGHYKLFWDGDTGKNDKHKVFWVDCPPAAQAAQVTPTPKPTPPGQAVQPTPKPTPAGQAVQPTPKPTPTLPGTVGGGARTPVPTLPPTDTLESQAQSAGNVAGVLLVLMAIGSLAIGATVLRPRPIRTRR
jgi:hypothetical protein